MTEANHVTTQTPKFLFTKKKDLESNGLTDLKSVKYVIRIKVLSNKLLPAYFYYNFK